MDIYRAAKRRGKYLTLATDTEVNSCAYILIKIIQVSEVYERNDGANNINNTELFLKLFQIQCKEIGKQKVLRRNNGT